MTSVATISIWVIASTIISAIVSAAIIAVITGIAIVEIIPGIISIRISVRIRIPITTIWIIRGTTTDYNATSGSSTADTNSDRE